MAKGLKRGIRRFFTSLAMGFSSLLFLLVIAGPLLVIYKWNSSDAIICFFIACYYLFVSILGFEGLKWVFKKGKAGLVEKKPEIENDDDERSLVPEIKINQEGQHYYSLCNLESYNPTTVISKSNIIGIINPKYAEQLPAKCSYNWNLQDINFCINTDKSQVYEDSDSNLHVYFDFEVFIKTAGNFTNSKFFEAFYSENAAELNFETKQKYMYKQFEKLNALIEKQKNDLSSDPDILMQLKNIFFPNLDEDKLLVFEKLPCTTERYTTLWNVQNGEEVYKRHGLKLNIFSKKELKVQNTKRDKNSSQLVKVSSES